MVFDLIYAMCACHLQKFYSLFENGVGPDQRTSDQEQHIVIHMMNQY